MKGNNKLDTSKVLILELITSLMEQFQLKSLLLKPTELSSCQWDTELIKADVCRSTSCQKIRLAKIVLVHNFGAGIDFDLRGKRFWQLSRSKI